MRIFATVLARGGELTDGVIESDQFSMPLVALSSKRLKIRPKLSQELTTKLFSIDSSLCRYTFYADTSGGRLERTRQTTMGDIIVDSHASAAMYILLTKSYM